MVLTTTTTSRFLFENDVGTHDKLAQTRVVDTAAMVDGVTSGGSLGEDPRAFVDRRVFGVAVRKMMFLPRVSRQNYVQRA